MRWKTIPNTGGVYQITRRGEIRIHPKCSDNPYKRIKRGEKISSHLSKGGYWMTNIYWADGKYSLVAVHRLLLMTFRPVKGVEKLQVNHIDGDKTNNRLSNLEWCTQKENLDHAWSAGLRKKPVRDILSEDDVRVIRSAYVKGQPPTLEELGKKYGVTPHAIWRTVHKKNWKHIQ